MTPNALPDNPLLDFSGLPRFDTLMPGDVQPAITTLLAQDRALIKRLTADDVAATWENFAAPLTDAFEQLSRAWGWSRMCHSVNDVPGGATPTTACSPKSPASMPKSART